MWFKFDYKKFNQKFDLSYLIITTSMLWLILIPVLKHSIVNHKLFWLGVFLVWYIILFLVFSNNIFKYLKELIQKSILLKIVCNMMLFFIWMWVLYAQTNKYYHIKKISISKKIPQKTSSSLSIGKYNYEMFDENLYPWAEWKKVETLQSFLNDEWYYNYEISWKFDEKTRLAMNQFLTSACNWEKTNLWLLWPQARDCIRDYLVLKQKRP